MPLSYYLFPVLYFPLITYFFSPKSFYFRKNNEKTVMTWWVFFFNYVRILKKKYWKKKTKIKDRRDNNRKLFFYTLFNFSDIERVRKSVIEGYIKEKFLFKERKSEWVSEKKEKDGVRTSEWKRKVNKAVRG